MKLTASALLVIAGLAAVPGCSSPAEAPLSVAPDGGQPDRATPPSEQAAADKVLEQARELFDAARAAREGKNHSLAREQAARAIDVLLAAGDETSEGARTKLLVELGAFASSTGELRAAKRARQRVLESRTRALP